ncbi:MAG: hypothetical protein ACEPOZ_14570 [Marinifilaceae bacterium]
MGKPRSIGGQNFRFRVLLAKSSGIEAEQGEFVLAFFPTVCKKKFFEKRGKYFFRVLTITEKWRKFNINNYKIDAYENCRYYKG